MIDYVLFIGMMATGYYYNVTFVQLGLVDLGQRLLGMDERQVVMEMALLALFTCVIALGVGLLSLRLHWERQLARRLRIALAVVTLQTILTVAAPLLPNPAWFRGWTLLASIALGVGVPVTFSLTVDLIPMRDRGYVAAAITGIAYFAAPVLFGDWCIEQFSAQMLLIDGVHHPVDPRHRAGADPGGHRGCVWADWLGIRPCRLIVRRWSALPLAAFLGTAFFMLLLEAITVVPLVGRLIPLLLAVTGVRAVLLTRFGRQRFVPATEMVSAERSETLGVR